MPLIQRFRESWLRPALFFGNNPISLAGGAITTASGVTMISYWVAELSGHLSDNPYVGIIFFLFMPGLFLLGLALIPIGIFLRRKKLKRPDRFPPNSPRSISAILSFGTASISCWWPRSSTSSWWRRPVTAARAYMDSPQFCGRSCHVMQPEYTAYQIGAHSHVACVECHIGSGAEGLLQRQGQRHQAAY